MQIQTNFSSKTIPDKYGCNVTPEHLNHGINQQSFPFQIITLPTGTSYVCWTLIDYDTIPLIGFPWIHWVVANYPVHTKTISIAPNFSESALLPQGRNSIDSLVQRIRHPLWRHTSFGQNLAIHYSGPRPRQGSHQYRLTVYALKTLIPVENGFYLNTLFDHLESVILDQTSLNLSYERRQP